MTGVQTCALPICDTRIHATAHRNQSFFQLNPSLSVTLVFFDTAGRRFVNTVILVNTGILANTGIFVGTVIFVNTDIFVGMVIFVGMMLYS